MATMEGQTTPQGAQLRERAQVRCPEVLLQVAASLRHRAHRLVLWEQAFSETRRIYLAEYGAFALDTVESSHYGGLLDSYFPISRSMERAKEAKAYLFKTLTSRARVVRSIDFKMTLFVGVMGELASFRALNWSKL